MNYYNEYTIDNELSHHGIKGQRWGVRHGPPYPLNRGARSASRIHRKTKSISGTSNKLETYRSKMIGRYEKTNPSKAEEYRKISNEELAAEYQRRKKVEKAVIAAAAVVGISAACYLVLRSDVVKQLSESGHKDPKKVLKKSLEDLDYVIHKDSVMHRMVGFENFDLEQTRGKVTYVTATKSDRLAYMAWLKDWSGTGKRYDVSLKATKALKLPSDKKAKQIFEELWSSDPTYKNELIMSIADAWYERSNDIDKYRGPMERIRLKGRIIDEVTKQVNADPFKMGIYSFVLQKEDSKKLVELYKSHGYDGIVDYFDKGTMAKIPVILFDALKDTVKQGEEFVTLTMRAQAIQKVALDEHQPLYESTKKYGDMTLRQIEEIFR